MKTQKGHVLIPAFATRTPSSVADVSHVKSETAVLRTLIVLVVAKSINSLGQFEASLGRTYVALLGPLVDSDNVFLCMS